ncbi:unnamed protein product [Adineta steineri]|uniref:Uncharacterized protein n=1 Tax=Adineta steineri TaxID=433720 RepID=A0A819DBG8_9BILA|nr:unnamed protein product [Adineta steineri]CAF3830868.1 unnamed protein product [Adineta steineri]
MHRVYQNVFKNTPAMDLRLIVGNRNRRNAKNELIRKRPKRSLLQCKQMQNKYKKMLERRKQNKKSVTTNVQTNNT